MSNLFIVVIIDPSRGMPVALSRKQVFESREEAMQALQDEKSDFGGMYTHYALLELTPIPSE